MTETVRKGKFQRRVDRAAVARDWAGRGYSCHPFRDSPGRVWRDFTHATNELVTVEQGRLEVEIEGRTATAETGDEVFIPKNAVHTVRNSDDGETIWLFGYD